LDIAYAQLTELTNPSDKPFISRHTSLKTLSRRRPMEEQWQVDRARLRTLRQQHPNWSYPELAQYLSRSISWVKKWSKRLKMAAPEDQTVLKSQSCRPKHLPPSIEPSVVERILAIRDQPPEGLQRTPGPVAIKYYLHKMENTAPLGCYLPTSTSTIWCILDEHRRISRPTQSEREPLPQAEPFQVWQIDFKDVTTVALEPARGVSRRHASIFKQGLGVVVEDLGSVNGTFVNGKRLDPYLPEPLRDGDTLQLGKLLIKVIIRGQ
jgi:hypothetical protein